MAAEPLLGQLPEGWEYTTLGAACEQGGGDIQTGPFGSQLHAADYVPSGVPSIMPQNIGDNRVVEDGIARITAADARRLSRYLVRRGDIVYSRRGDVERRALIREREDGWLCGTGCLRVRFGTAGVDPEYGSYYLGHPAVRNWVVRHAHGATMPNLNTSILAACPLVIPPKDEQRAIADVLGTLDDRIELNLRMNETLEATARTIFRSWFVNFDPVRAKVAGRDPGVSPPIAELFPDGVDDTRAEQTPAGWRAASLADLAQLNPESWTRETRPDVLGYVDLSNIKWGRIEAVTTHTAATAPSRAQRVLRPGDTVVGTVRPGNGSYAFITDSGLTGSTGFAVLRPSRPEYAEFVYLAATDDENIQALAHLADGAAYPAVRPDAVLATPVIRPPDRVLARFAELSRPLFDAMAQNEQLSGVLAALRDTLLPKLMSGELRAPQSERILEAVTG